MLAAGPPGWKSSSGSMCSSQSMPSSSASRSASASPYPGVQRTGWEGVLTQDIHVIPLPLPLSGKVGLGPPGHTRAAANASNAETAGVTHCTAAPLQASSQSYSVFSSTTQAAGSQLSTPAYCSTIASPLKRTGTPPSEQPTLLNQELIVAWLPAPLLRLLGVELKLGPLLGGGKGRVQVHEAHVPNARQELHRSSIGAVVEKLHRGGREGRDEGEVACHAGRSRPVAGAAQLLTLGSETIGVRQHKTLVSVSVALQQASPFGQLVYKPHHRPH